MHARTRADACPEPSRRSWTVDRQLRFLDTLARSRNVGQAAAAAGMSRESAYRLRKRDGAALFAALWDIALAPALSAKGHSGKLPDGRLARLLGSHFRRERGHDGAIGYGLRQRAQDELDANFVTFAQAAGTRA